MKELYYFSKSDVMIQVQHAGQSHSFRYASHRKLSDEERATIERYLLKNLANDTEGDYGGANLDYLGIDYKLISSLNQFHAVKPFKDSERGNHTQSRNPFKSLVSKDIEKSVAHLIKTSMSNYYFEKIGNTILEARREMEEDPQAGERHQYRSALEELVEAYNEYSDKKVEVKDVLPAELIS
ncbi:MAG: hypothetical protein ACE5IY_09370 [bacterium]